MTHAAKAANDLQQQQQQQHLPQDRGSMAKTGCQVATRSAVTDLAKPPGLPLIIHVRPADPETPSRVV